ncbi:MAG: lamin tail domain-containing protein [Saprospiraceae bacterium]|nr:lamin tail domain-containing protein [Saprospiraceae bacterium]MDW8230511.1 lamin tail domain-containing protein [Saprospiraceae bacterium]
MKKHILILLSAWCLSWAANAQIVLTEIMYNPPEAGVDSLEFLEFYNKSNAPVNLEGWYLYGVNFTFPNVVLNPGQYIVTSVNATALFNQLGVTSLQWGPNSALSNTGELLLLLNPAADTICRVQYGNAAPWPTEAAGNGASLVLCNPNSDPSLPSSWRAATTSTGVTINNRVIFANPGAPSQCPTGVAANDDAVVVPAGEPTVINILQNDILPGPGGFVVTITAAPKHGSVVINPNGTLTYTSSAGYCGPDSLTYQVCQGTDCAQAKVRITVRCYPPYAIKQINKVNANGVADSIGVYCQLTATVYGVNLRGTAGLQFAMIDNDHDGITVFSATRNFGYTVKEGDRIAVRGAIGQFNGLLQIFPDTIFRLSGNNPLLPPIEVIKPVENTENKLIRIRKLRYVNINQWSPGVGPGFNVLMVSDDHPNDTVLVRIDNDVDLYNQAPPPVPFDLTGIGSQFDTLAPFTTGYQILPRYIPDVSTLVSSHEADFSAHVRLMPNPATDVLRLQLAETFDQIRLFTADGRLLTVLFQPHGEVTLPVETLAPGVYLLHFEKDQRYWTTRFIKQ